MKLLIIQHAGSITSLGVGAELVGLVTKERAFCRGDTLPEGRWKRIPPYASGRKVLKTRDALFKCQKGVQHTVGTQILVLT